MLVKGIAQPKLILLLFIGYFILYLALIAARFTPPGLTISASAGGI
jgi:hypothetical protein